MANVISQEEHVQKLGVVNVVYNVGGFPKHGMDYEKSRRLARLFRAIPVRFDSFYVCLDESAWFTVVDTFAVSQAIILCSVSFLFSQSHVSFYFVLGHDWKILAHATSHGQR